MARRVASKTVAVGPAMPGPGWWDRVGADLLPALAPAGIWTEFSAWEEPAADVILIVKHLPPADWVDRMAKRAAILYCPIDYYGNADDVAADAPTLRRCARILIHSEAHRPVFEPYARVETVEFSVRYAVPPRRRFVQEGFVLWVGGRSDLPPLIDWVNAHPLPGELVVLSHFDDLDHLPSPGEVGFLPGLNVQLESWSPGRQLELTRDCRAAFDIMDDDFRSRHSSAAKAVDFLASGVPFAQSADSNLAASLAGQGFQVASPLDPERWCSRAYWEECRSVGRVLRRRLTVAKVAARYRCLVEDTLRERSICVDTLGPLMEHVTSPAAESLASQARNNLGSESVPTTASAYEQALRLVAAGRLAEAEGHYERLTSVEERHVAALVLNDRAALSAVRGDWTAARGGFAAAIQLDSDCAPAQHNLAILNAPDGASPTAFRRIDSAPDDAAARGTTGGSPPPVKVAVVSFLFNWPSTGGGIVHTVELCRFLHEAGYDVRHIYCRFDPWEIGRVEAALAVPTECLHFAANEWTLEPILGRFRHAVDRFAPDYVIITDSWNIKPLLADAFRGHRVILRLQAMECLCPLNNVRLLPGPGGRVSQCPKHQLATPGECRRCLDELGATSGGLHRAERGLCGVGTPAYDAALRRAFREAEAVLVVNPLTEALVSPYARIVKVVTAGMDPARFPWPWPVDPAEPPEGRPVRLLFAGLVAEWMKGFHVLHDACTRLWRSRQDFELLATADPPGRLDDFTRYVGWLSQADLPRQIRAADILVMPTIAQEGLGRTAVEAMGCGRPVVASRIGGLSTTVLDGNTGLLFEPGDAADLAAKLGILIADPDLRRRLGEAGRRRFEESYAWPIIIDRHYRPLLKPRGGHVSPGAAAAATHRE